jgi:hypothetical protein
MTKSARWAHARYQYVSVEGFLWRFPTAGYRRWLEAVAGGDRFAKFEVYGAKCIGTVSNVLDWDASDARTELDDENAWDGAGQFRAIRNRNGAKR